jgi:zinc transporter
MGDSRELGPHPKVDGDPPGLLSGFRFAADGKAASLSDLAAIEMPPDGWCWLHINLADQRCRGWLGTLPGIPKLDLDFLQSSDDVQQLTASDESLRGIIFDTVYTFEGKSEDFGFLRFVMTDRMLVTGRRQAMQSAEMVRREIEGGRRFASPVDLMRALVEEIGNGIDMIVDGLATEIDAIEDALLRDRMDDERKRLGRVRLMTVRIHRRLNGLRSLFRRMAGDHTAEKAERLRKDAGHFVQRFDEIDHDVVELRDRARLLQDEITIKLAEQTNRNLHILSVVTALLLPPTLVTGLFGMNVEGLPFTGSPVGFWWVAALALAVAGAAGWILGMLGMFGQGGANRRKR